MKKHNYLKMFILISFFFYFSPVCLISNTTTIEDTSTFIQDKSTIENQNHLPKEDKDSIDIESFLLGVGGIVIGFILSTIKDIWFKYYEKKESYLFKLYDKRLQVHQEAFSYIRKIEKFIIESKGLSIDDKKECYKNILNPFQDWFSNNCFYLDNESWEKVSNCFMNNKIDLYIIKENTEILQEISEAKKSILKSIGMKHVNLGYKKYISLIEK